MPATIIPYDKALPEVPGRNPYTKPNAYLHKLGEGNYEVQSGRRPSSMFLVEKLRVAGDSWRETGYPGLSPTTQRLFQYWFEEDHLLGNFGFRYYWAQREALETLAYLVEVRRFDDFRPLAEAFGNVPRKEWCQKISVQTGQVWRYLKVPQREFEASRAKTLGDLTREPGKNQPGLF